MKISNRRFFSKRQRNNLRILAGNQCVNCGDALTQGFHADHIIPFCVGGKTLLNNGQALCPSCNLKKGRNMQTNLNLREWQKTAHNKCLSWFRGGPSQKHFIINAAPGAGKTFCASIIADTLIKNKEIKRVIVIAPRAEVVRQWGQEFFSVTGRHMTKVTASDADIEGFGEDLSVTWASVQDLSDSFKVVCDRDDTLVICDEHHHAAVQAAWGNGAINAFKNAKFVLILTGTPIRSDGEAAAWIAYDSKGQINHPEPGTYTLSYGDAVELNYCRPATFHRHQGKFEVSLNDGATIKVDGTQETSFPDGLRSIPALKNALDFYKIVCTPKFKSDGITPDLKSYHASMVSSAISKLEQVRHQMPEAGGLVIAPNIQMAEYFCQILEMIDGEKPILVHSQVPNADEKISAFRHSNKRWIVSVAMISEGVDIKRLRVLIYLPNAQTELSFRQAVGRVVRTNQRDDLSRAYIVMPTHKVFETFARRVEDEMPPSKLKEEKPKTKKCPICEEECAFNARECVECGHEFRNSSPRLFECDDCGHLNPIGSKECASCGKEFSEEFEVTLKEALRHGVIARGMELSEDETRKSERISSSLRADILSSGDEVLINLISKIPEESDARLARIFAKYQ